MGGVHSIGLGERLLKIGSRSARGGPYLYFYDSTGQLIGDYEKTKGAKQTANWVSKQETIWLGDIPVAIIKRPIATEPVQVYYIHTDHLNTPRLIVNQNNIPVWHWDNVHAFGSNLPDENPDGDRQSFEYNLRFPGQYFDKETGLHYNYFRYYEPETGRYLTPDPIGLAGGLNIYGYVEQNSLKWADPLGLDAQVTVWQPVGWGSSSFGHVSISINGTTWSWGPNGMTKISQSDYNSRNSFRSGVTSNIPLTSAQDAKLARFLNNYRGDYNPITKNCTAPVQQGLQNIGINIGNNILPVSVGNAILDKGIASRLIFNKTLQPAIGSSAPWAK